MILVLLILLPLLAGLLGWRLGRTWGPTIPRVIAMAAMVLELLLAAWLWMQAPIAPAPGSSAYLAVWQMPWLPMFGASIHLAMDGLSLLMVTLTAVLGIAAVACGWRSVAQRAGFYHLNLLAVLSGVIGVFTAMDLLLLYFFWELMLVPMYFLIDIWGHEQRHRAAVKFFLFTQLSGLAMLVSILAMYFLHHGATGRYTFDYAELLGTPMSARAAFGLMLGFFAAFAVKLPVVGLHTWLPDAHTEAPTAGSVVLAGLLLKTGAYGMLRFLLPLFPQACREFAPVAMALGVAGIFYGAVLAFAQNDLKRLVAYSSVSHMGFVMLGVFAGTALAMRGAVMQMVCHGISTPALFILVGAIQDRIGTRDLRRMGGLWAQTPRLAAMAMLFAMASLGLPGLGNFIAEFLVLLGSWPGHAVLTSLAAASLIASVLYALWMMQRAFHGQPREPFKPDDLRAGELATMIFLTAVIVALGLYPQPVLDAAGSSLAAIRMLFTAAGGLP